MGTGQPALGMRMRMHMRRCVLWLAAVQILLAHTCVGSVELVPCPPEKYRVGALEGSRQSVHLAGSCAPCDNSTCAADAHRVGTCSGTTNDWQCPKKILASGLPCPRDWHETNLGGEIESEGNIAVGAASYFTKEEVGVIVKHTMAGGFFVNAGGWNRKAATFGLCRTTCLALPDCFAFQVRAPLT